jgi:amino acid adenylation domain-containing protein
MSDFVNNQLIIPSEQQAIRNQCFHPSGAFEEFAKEDIEQSIPARFEKIVRMFPGQIAVKTADQTLTYTELNASANRVGRAILFRIGADAECVALLFDQGAALIASMIGALKAGKYFVVLDPTAPRHRTSVVLQNAGAALVITDQRHLSLASEMCGGSIPTLDITDSTVSPDNLPVSLRPDAIAFFAYTSGSTGQPKGVVWTHRLLLHHEMLSINTSHICKDDRITLLSFGTSNAITNVFLALLAGAALLPFDVQSSGVTELGRWLKRERITVCLISATLFRSLCAVLPRGEVLTEVRLLKARSEGAHWGDIDLFHKHFAAHCVLLHGLSSSETGFVAAFQCDQNTAISEGEVPIGYPLSDKEVLLMDESDREVGCNQVGEIVVRSRYLAEGYWHMPELSRAKFKADPQCPEKRLYYTGDLGLRRPDGCLVHKGRKDFRVKIRGYGVEFAEVEKVLCEHPSVAQGLVSSRKNDTGEEQLVGYFIANGEPAPTISELRGFLRSKLPDYMIPSMFVRIDALPLTPNGKVDRKALPEPEKARPLLDVLYVEPRNELERGLAQIWAGVLSLKSVGVHDNFFDLGGHSLSAVRLVSEAERRLGKKISVATLLKSPTIAQMAIEIPEQGKVARSPLIAVQPNGSKPPFFCVHGTDSYGRLAQYLGPDQPFFGLAQHLEGRKVRYTRIEDIAAYYLGEIQTVQPCGPYYLGGHSLGGLIAFEVAQQLQYQQQTIALLVLLDSGAPKSRRGAPSNPSMTVETTYKSRSHFMGRLAETFRTIRWGAKEKLLKDVKTAVCEVYHRLGISLPPLLQTFYVDQVVYGAIYAKAHRSYVPQSYLGRAVYLKSEDTRDRVDGWKKLVTQGLEVYSVPGDHFSMLAEPHLKCLALTLIQCLARAQAGSSTGAQSGRESGVVSREERQNKVQRELTAIEV